MLLREERSRLDDEIRKQTFSLAGLVIPFDTPGDPCPRCKGPMLVRKSARHRVVTLKHGSFFARETVLACKKGCTSSSGKMITRRSELLPRWMEAGSIYG